MINLLLYFLVFGYTYMRQERCFSTSTGAFQCCFQCWQKKENGSVRLCFVPYFCLLIIQLHNFGCSAPGICTYLSPSSQKPLLDQAGRWLKKLSVSPYGSKELLCIHENRTPSNFDFFMPWIEILRLRGYAAFHITLMIFSSNAEECRYQQHQEFWIISGFRQLQNKYF